MSFKIFKEQFARKLSSRFFTSNPVVLGTIISIVILIAILGVGLSVVFTKTLEKFIWENKTEPVFNLVQGQSVQHLQFIHYFDNSQTNEAQQAFNDFADELKMSLSYVFSVQVYDTSGVLIWADILKEKVGQKHEEEDIFETLESGQIIKQPKEEILREMGNSHLLEVYTPVILDQNNIGVVEVYFDISNVQALVNRVRLCVWGSIFALVLVISLLLYLAFRSQNKLITRQSEELAAIANELKTTLMSIGEGAFSIDENGKIVLFNKTAEEISGYKSEDVIGKHYKSVLKFLFEKDFYEDDFIESVLQKGAISLISNHKILISKEKKEVPVEESAAPIKDKSGKIVGVVVIFRDMTKMRELERTRMNFISIASHQLRTPLSSMRWVSEMLLSGDAGRISKRQKVFINDIYKSVRRLIDLVNTLLVSSRIEENRVNITPTPVDIVKDTRQVLTELVPLVEAKNLDIQFNVASIPLINLEPGMFRQVVLNLISNAISYTPKNGRITIGFKLIADRAQVSVSDNGIGISDKDKKRIFEKFYRADNAKAMVADGNGLGLSLAKSIIAIWNGDIWFDSEEGRGSTFYFTVPLAGMQSKKSGSATSN